MDVDQIEGIVYNRVLKKTRCTYYARGRMLFPPFGGCTIRYYIKAPWKVKSRFNKTPYRPYLWTWNNSFIHNIWARWAWKHVDRIEKEVKEEFLHGSK